MYNNKCECINDTTIENIVVGNFYRWHCMNGAYKVMYDETDKTFQVAYGNEEWFDKHFKRV